MPIYYDFGVLFRVGTSYFAYVDPNILKGELKMKISKQRLRQILKEELEMAQMTLPNGEIDHEGDMAKRQLANIAEYAAELSEMLQDDTQLESWVQAKITKAADYIKTVKHHLEYDMKAGKHDQVTAQMPKMDPMLGQIGEFPLEMDEMESESDETYEF